MLTSPRTAKETGYISSLKLFMMTKPFYKAAIMAQKTLGSFANRVTSTPKIATPTPSQARQQKSSKI